MVQSVLPVCWWLTSSVFIITLNHLIRRHFLRDFDFSVKHNEWSHGCSSWKDPVPFFPFCCFLCFDISRSTPTARTACPRPAWLLLSLFIPPCFWPWRVKSKGIRGKQNGNRRTGNPPLRQFGSRCAQAEVVTGAGSSLWESEAERLSECEMMIVMMRFCLNAGPLLRRWGERWSYGGEAVRTSCWDNDQTSVFWGAGCCDARKGRERTGPPSDRGGDVLWQWWGLRVRPCVYMCEKETDIVPVTRRRKMFFWNITPNSFEFSISYHLPSTTTGATTIRETVKMHIFFLFTLTSGSSDWMELLSMLPIWIFTFYCNTAWMSVMQTLLSVTSVACGEGIWKLRPTSESIPT